MNIFKTWNAKLNNYASVELRGNQLLNHIPYISMKDVDKLTDSRIIFIKPLKEDYLTINKCSYKNKVFIDILDDFSNIRELVNTLHNNITAIWPSYYALSTFKMFFDRNYVVYHQADQRLSYSSYNNITKPNAIYYGSVHKYRKMFNNIKCISPSKNNLSILTNYNIHYISRTSPYRYDPVTKLSTASKIPNTVVYLSLSDVGYAEILGQEYPFYIEKFKSIEDVKASFNTAIWYKAIKRMRFINDNVLNFNLIQSQILNIINN